MSKLKILTICQHGSVRSVACAYLIKTIYKHDAIAMGVDDAEPETQEMLYNWADKIILMDKTLLDKVVINIPAYIKTEITMCDVGEDVWHDQNAQGLHHKILRQLLKLNL
jgi:predicted protein tyrosine phosphatase